MSKYSPLQEHLQDLTVREWNASFADVEKLINGILPKSAYEHQAWWSNNPTGHSHARSWVEAGWKTEDVNMSARRLVFRRLDAVIENSMAESMPPLWGYMRGTVTVLNDADLTEPFNEEWQHHV